MKTRIVITALVASLALASTAEARFRHLTGTFDNDANATVSMDVVIRHDRPVRVMNIEVTHLDYTCESGETGERSASLGGAIVFRSSRRPLHEFFIEDTGGSDHHFVAGGLMRRSGRSVSGGISYFFESSGGFCESSPAGGRYRASQR